MTKEKQIEEMAKNVCHLDRTCDECMTSFECKAMMYAKRFYNAGYRKADEVALKVIGEVEEIIDKFYNKHCFKSDLEDIEIDAVINFSDDISSDLAELKKKYTESESKK